MSGFIEVHDKDGDPRTISVRFIQEFGPVKSEDGIVKAYVQVSDGVNYVIESYESVRAAVEASSDWAIAKAEGAK